MRRESQCRSDAKPPSGSRMARSGQSVKVVGEGGVRVVGSGGGEGSRGKRARESILPSAFREERVL